MDTKRVIVLSGILLIIAISIYSFFLESDFYIDIEHSMPDNPPIDIKVSIDGKEVESSLFKRFSFPAIDDENTFGYNGLIGWSGGTELKISKGFHTIRIESEKANIKIEERFFIWRWEQRALIQYIDDKFIFQLLDKARIYA